MANYYMGVDPGPSTGVALLSFSDLEPPSWSVFQVDGGTAIWLIETLISQWKPSVVAIEEFEVRKGHAGTSGADAELTRSLVHRTKALCEKSPESPLFRVRRATDVKPWASDKRLAKTAFPWGAKFKDARDAGRQALFAAVRDGRMRDPLA